MTELSIDILHAIFRLLEQRDKLECMTVCRLWNQIIGHYSLFRVVRVDRRKQLDKLIERVTKQPILGTKVERLILDLRLDDDDFDMAVLVDLFPNVRDFVALSTRHPHLDMSSIEKRVQHPWCSVVESMAEFTSDISIKTLLASGVCSRLTRIAMEGTEGYLVNDFIELLGNAPALRTLDMSQYRISLHDLELLHERAPHLTCLVLESIEFDCLSFPRNIEPASTVKTLKLNSSRFDIIEDSVAQIQYVCAKYTNLAELSYDVKSFEEEDSELETTYNDAIVAYLKVLGTKLHTLSLHIDSDLIDPLFPFDFDAFNKGKCQIRNLSLGRDIKPFMIDQLAHTSQVNYIQSLTINHLVDCTSLDWLKSFTMLKELTMHFPYYSKIAQRQRLNMNQLLAILGNRLESLALYSMQLKFDATTIRKYPLKSLTMFKVTLPPKTDMFINQSFPHIRSLKFERCFWAGRSFTLPDINLSYLEITDKFPKRDRHILIITLNNNQRRLYTATEKPFYFISSKHDVPKDRFTYPSISSQPFGEYNGTPVLTFACNSLYNFFTMNSMF